jgi:hypothetical protein
MGHKMSVAKIGSPSLQGRFIIMIGYINAKMVAWISSGRRAQKKPLVSQDSRLHRKTK